MIMKTIKLLIEAFVAAAALESMALFVMLANGAGVELLLVGVWLCQMTLSSSLLLALLWLGPKWAE